MASKIVDNQYLKDAILLAVAAQYIKQKKMAEAQWVLSEAGCSAEKDWICYDFIQGILTSGAYDQAFELMKEVIWYDNGLADELRGRIAESYFSNSLSKSYLDISQLLVFLNSMTDAELKDQLIISMGKKLYQDRRQSSAQQLFTNMTTNDALRDRFINNIRKGLPI